MNVMPESWVSGDHSAIASRLLAEFGRSRSADTADVEYYRDPTPPPVVDVSKQAELRTFVTAVYGSRRRPHVLTALEPGPAFDPDEWAGVVTRITAELAETGERTIVHWWGLTGRPVAGYWVGEASGLRLSEPPNDWARLEQILGEHPVVLEFPLRLTGSAQVNLDARSSWATKHGLLLNGLIRGGLQAPRSRAQSHWATHIGAAKPLWVTDGYVPPNGFQAESSEYRDLAGLQPMELVPETEYYSEHWYAGDGLQLPDSLDRDVCRFYDIEPGKRADIERALYWFERAGRMWNVSESMYFLAHASAIESMSASEVGEPCPQCGKPAIGPTRAFKEFLVEFGGIDSKQADALYTLRSDLTHGEGLLLRDEELGRAMNRVSLQHAEALSLMSRAVRSAIRGFLHDQSDH